MKKFISVFLIFYMLFNLCANDFINEKLDRQDELLNSLELEMNTLRNLVISLQTDNSNLITYSDSLEKRIELCNQKITEMQETIESTREALMSNKEDTGEIIGILGDMQNALDRYKMYLAELERKAKRTDKFIQIAIPVLSLPMVANGVYLYINGDEDYGRICIIEGAVLFVGAEVLWNSGKFILKIW